MSNSNTTSKPKRMGLAVVLTAILLISIFAMAPAPAQTAAASNAQPQLLALAAEQPDEPVHVTIQKSDAAADAVGLVAKMSGTANDKLNMIIADGADMGVETAVDLSCDASVNWGKISWDE
jgi:hypothetical protein